MPTAYGLLMNKSHQPVWNGCFADMTKREGLSLWPLSLPFYYLPACLLHGLPFANFFFLSSAQTDSSFSCLGKSQQENAQDWWGGEGSYIGSFLCLFSNIFSFLFEAVVISVVLVNTSYIYRLLTFITFYRNLHSAANSTSSQLLVFPYFTQPRENSVAYFSWEFSNNISWQKKNEELFLPNF